MTDDNPERDSLAKCAVCGVPIAALPFDGEWRCGMCFMKLIYPDPEFDK